MVEDPPGRGALEVIGLGAMNLDHLYWVERLLTDGEAPVLETAICPGGSAANTIYGLARLGVLTGYVGAVGDDEAGRLLVADLAEAGVDTGHIMVKEASSGATLILSDRRGHRAIYIVPGANSLLSLDYL